MQLDQDGSTFFFNWTIRIANLDIENDDTISVEYVWVAQTSDDLVWFVMIWEDLDNGRICMHRINKATRTISTNSYFFSGMGQRKSIYQDWDVLHYNYDDDVWDPQHRDQDMDSDTIWGEQSWYDTGWTDVTWETVSWLWKTWTSSYDNQSAGWEDNTIPFLIAS